VAAIVCDRSRASVKGEILALTISQEEEDARIYEDFADGLKEN
jgi:hypothetical protein